MCERSFVFDIINMENSTCMFKSVQNYTLNTLLGLTQRRIINWRKTLGAQSNTVHKLDKPRLSHRQNKMTFIIDNELILEAWFTWLNTWADDWLTIKTHIYANRTSKRKPTRIADKRESVRPSCSLFIFWIEFTSWISLCFATFGELPARTTLL